jgi:hypothetical protein
MNDPVSPDAYSDLVAGIEEKTRGGGEHHVAKFFPSGEVDTSRENTFADRDALNEWRENLPAEDTAVVVEFESDGPPPDHERAPRSENSRGDSPQSDSAQ